MTEKPLYLEINQIGVVPPTEYENALGDALEAAFAQGVHELKPLVARLNETRVRPPQGGEWTSDNLKAELKRLGD